MPVRKRETRNSGSRKNTSIEKFENLSNIKDSGQIVASLFGNDSSLNISGRKSEGKRKSLPFMSDSQESTVENEIECEVEDVNEKKEIWNAQVTKTNSKQTKQSEVVDSKTKNVLIHKLTPDELESHYSQCIDLFSKNKVNVKNAFKLQLIDFMKLMMDRKTDKSENLALMSCTLDASAKIYSCRVDNVYTNILKFVKSYQSGGKIKDDDKEEQGNSPSKGSGNEASSDDEENASKKKKEQKRKSPRANKKNLVKESDYLNRKDVKLCYYRQNLPRNQTYFFESSILDDGNKLAPNRPLFIKFIPDAQNTSNFTIDPIWKGEMDKDNFEEKISGYRELRSKVFIPDDGPEEELNLDSENAFVYDPSIESIAEIRNFNEISDGQSECGDEDTGGEVEIDYDDCDMEPQFDDINEDKELYISQRSDQPVPCSDRLSIPETNAFKPKISFTPIAMSRMLRSSASKPSDYSFFDDSKLAFMPSATHWKIKPSKRSIDAVGKTPSQPTRRAKTQYLDFLSENQIESALEAIQEDNNLSHKLSIKTTKDWFYKKTDLIFMPIIPNVRKKLLSLFQDTETCILNVVRHPDLEDPRECDVNQSVLLNPIDFNTPDADDYDDDHHDGGDYHPLEDWSEKMEPDKKNSALENPGEEDNHIENEDNPEAPEDNDQDFLVPLPMKVEKVSVKCAKSQKRIDIKKLKGAIWNLLDLENTNSENKENNERGSNSKSPKKEEVKYSEIFEALPERISKEAAAELSYPIAFMAILHMANEKTLRLTGNEDHSDFTVSFDSPPKN